MEHFSCARQCAHIDTPKRSVGLPVWEISSSRGSQSPLEHMGQCDRECQEAGGELSYCKKVGLSREGLERKETASRDEAGVSQAKGVNSTHTGHASNLTGASGSRKRARAGGGPTVRRHSSGKKAARGQSTEAVCVSSPAV